MQSKLKKRILFDVLDGIPPSKNETDEYLMYRQIIENSILAMEKEAIDLGINRNIVDFTEDFR